MDNPSYTLTDQQHEAISLLAKGFNKKEAAEKLGIHRTQLYRWLTIPEFKRAIQKEYGDTYKASKRRVRSLLSTGVKTAERVLQDEHNRNFGRVFEIVCKITGILDDKPQVNIIILNSVTTYGQIMELRKLMEEKIPLLTDEEKAKLIQENVESFQALEEDEEESV